MEILPVIPEQTIITQGEEGDYFYIIGRWLGVRIYSLVLLVLYMLLFVEHGLFTVIVDDAAVTKIGDGELKPLYVIRNYSVQC